jgi:branched-subunit amino acid ABC-type transport system permease component
MGNMIVEIAQQQAQAALRRAVIPAAIAVVALVFFLFALVALFAALFFLEEPIYGPRSTALIVAAVAFALGLVAVLFLFVGRRPKPAPTPPPTESTLPQLLTLLAQAAPSVAPRQAAFAAALLALALGLMSRGSSTEKK